MTRELELHTDVLFVIRKAAELRSQDPEEVMSRSLNRELSSTRKIAVYVARNAFDYSTSKLGKLFNNRDHAFVVRSCQEVESWMGRYSKVRDMVKDLEQACLFKNQEFPPRFQRNDSSFLL